MKWADLVIYQQLPKWSHTYPLSLEDQPRSPLQSFPTSILEWEFSEVFLRASGVHTLLADNLVIWQQINNVALHSTPPKVLL